MLAGVEIFCNLICIPNKCSNYTVKVKLRLEQQILMLLRPRLMSECLRLWVRERGGKLTNGFKGLTKLDQSCSNRLEMNVFACTHIFSSLEKLLGHQINYAIILVYILLYANAERDVCYIDRTLSPILEDMLWNLSKNAG